MTGMNLALGSRNRAIYEQHLAGYRLGEIADNYNLCRESVTLILKRTRHWMQDARHCDPKAIKGLKRLGYTTLEIQKIMRGEA